MRYSTCDTATTSAALLSSNTYHSPLYKRRQAATVLSQPFPGIYRARHLRYNLLRWHLHVPG